MLLCEDLCFRHVARLSFVDKTHMNFGRGAAQNLYNYTALLTTNKGGNANNFADLVGGRGVVEALVDPVFRVLNMTLPVTLPG
jgi:hypothetical protein